MQRLFDARLLLLHLALGGGAHLHYRHTACELQGEVLCLNPCAPKSWPGFEIVYRDRSSRYEISVENPGGRGRGVTQLEIDGVVIASDSTRIPLHDDGATHRVRVSLG